MVLQTGLKVSVLNHTHVQDPCRCVRVACVLFPAPGPHALPLSGTAVCGHKHPLVTVALLGAEVTEISAGNGHPAVLHQEGSEKVTP